MRFMIIRKADLETEAGVMPGPELLAAMGKYNQELMQAGVMLDGGGLKPSSAATRVRLERGKYTVTDGPFADTKELVSGFSIWKVESKEQALELLAKWPHEDGHGEARLELRQMYEASDFGGDDSAAAPPPPERKPGATRYLVALHSSAFTESEDITSARRQKAMAAMGELMDELERSGALLGGVGLKPTAKGARIAFAKGGKHTVVDGPFAETKELIAGYTMIQGTKDEAIEFAKRWLAIHAAADDTATTVIDIRPVYEMEDFAAARKGV